LGWKCEGIYTALQPHPRRPGGRLVPGHRPSGGVDSFSVKRYLSFITELALLSVGFDVMEIAPYLDSGNTALMGAKYVREFIALCGHHGSDMLRAAFMIII